MAPSHFRVQSIATAHNDVAAGVRVVVGGGACGGAGKNRLFRARGRSRIRAALSTKRWRAGLLLGTGQITWTLALVLRRPNFLI